MFRLTGIILTPIVSAQLNVAGAPRQVGFHKDVAPILRRNCATCHSQNGLGHLQSGFSLESSAALMKGAKYGPMIDPGSSGQSNPVWLLRHRAHPQINMPKVCAQMGLVGDECANAAASPGSSRSARSTSSRHGSIKGRATTDVGRPSRGSGVAARHIKVCVRPGESLRGAPGRAATDPIGRGEPDLPRGCPAVRRARHTPIEAVPALIAATSVRGRCVQSVRGTCVIVSVAISAVRGGFPLAARFQGTARCRGAVGLAIAEGGVRLV